jgi:hypothetical protein
MPSTFHGYATLHEFDLLVQAGMKPLEAIRAGTSVSARAMGLDSERGTIAPGRAADLVLVQGRPDENIGDLLNTRHVFVSGVEYDPRQLEGAIQSREMTALPVRSVDPLIDDMEREDGRTRLGTLRVNGTDAGIDHSPMLFHRIVRSGGDHALLIQATMAQKENPYVRVEFPLTAASVSPADVSGFSGIQFDVRGEVAPRLLVSTYSGRSVSDPWAAGFSVSPEWQTVKIPFTDLKRRATGGWDARDLRAILVELSGPPKSGVWLEIDNLRLFR